ncbi:choice-of-anchor J domain-containing protein, partial [Flavobacterium enshiense]|uniref:choice-of-anchor J domain-containing protein n=1 Tax=Flavobacterium enshiense TaxID=1341165 RepID=UPI00345D0AED
MKKITLVIFMSLLSFLGYAQFPESFDTGIPATWRVMNNGFGAAQDWTTSSTLFLPTNSGSQHAIAGRANIGTGVTAENWLVSPQFTVPTNGQLRFWTKMTLSGDSGSLYQLRVSTTSQTDQSSFTTIQQWTEAQLEGDMAFGGSNAYNEYGEIIKNLTPTYTAGQQIYVAFVKVHTQTGGTASGDRWLIDDVNVAQQCQDPLTLTAYAISANQATLDWNSPGPATTWEIDFAASPLNPDGVADVTTSTKPYTLMGLIPGTQYSYYVRSVCATNNKSNWAGPFVFITTPLGQNCAGPIVVGALPYSNTSNTGLYGDVVDGSPGASCGITGNYLNGNDVFYSFTPSFTGVVDISMTPTGNNTGIFVYGSCADVGSICLAGVANTGGGVRNIPFFSVTAGTTYFIVISSSGTPQTFPYTLTIQQVACPPPNSLGASGISQTGATLTWGNPSGATAWEYVFQPAGTGLPTGAGTPTTATSAAITGLTANTNYEFYVRVDCGGGTYSAWAGPFQFRTLCNAFPIPFTEGFNSTSTSQACWTVLNINADANAWNMDYATNPFEGNQSASIVASSVANNDWLISPQITGLNGNQRLKFRYRVESATSPCTFEVRLSTNGASPSDMTSVLIAPTSYSNVTYVERIVNLSAFSGNVNIGWYVAPGANGSRIYIDQVIIEDMPACPEPTALTVSGVTANSATVNWIAGNTETSWQVLVQASGLPAPTLPTEGVTVTTTPTYNATPLNSSTTYDVYVLANCGATSSIWIGPVTFRTPQVPATLPFADTFEGNFDWDTVNGTQTNKWFAGTAASNGGTRSMYISNNNGVANAYTITTTSVAQTYRDLTIPAAVNQINVAFDWRAQGESTFDYFRVWVVPTTFIPTAGTQITAAADRINIAGGNINLGGATTWPRRNIVWNAAAFAGQNVRLVFEWRNDGSGGTQPPAAIDNVNVTVITCPAPTALTTVSTTQTEATLQWTAGGTETQWEIVVQAPGSGQPTGASTIIPAGTNPFTVPGLNPATMYEYYVRAVCGPGDASTWSGPSTFFTQCTILNVPFYEGFNSTSATQQCWTVTNSNADGDTWNMDYATNPFEGNQSAIILTDGNAGANDDWLISPTLNLSATPGAKRLKFHYRVQSAGEPNDFRVMISTTGVATANFTQTLIPLASYGNITYVERIVNLVDGTGTPYSGNVNLAWHVPAGGLDGWRLYIDNVIVEDIPPCPNPTTPTVLSVNQDSATLSWTPGFNETQWEIVVQAPGSGVPTGASTIIVANTNPFTVQGLNPSTQYEFYVRAYCNASEQSTWTGPVTFTTTQIPAVLNYVEDFESGTQMTFTNGTQTNKWAVGTATSNGGAQALYISNNNGANNAYTVSAGTVAHAYRDIFIPTGTNIMDLAFDWKGVGESSFDYLRVWSVPASFIPVAGTQITAASGGQQISANLNQSATWRTQTYEISGVPYSGQIMRLVFEWRNDTSAGTQPPAAVDNISLRIPTCPEPYNLITSGQTGSPEITLSWTPGGTETQWQVVIQAQGAGTPTGPGVTVNNTPSYTYTATHGVFYEYWVQAVCGSTDSSEWVGPYVFSVYAPPGCANVDVVGVGVDIVNNQVLLCPGTTGQNVELSASYFGIGATTSYEVSTIPYSPPFPFTGGTQMNITTDDIWSGVVNLPFNFCFFGNSYSTARVGSNGVVAFGIPDATTYCPWAFSTTIPNTGFPIKNAIYGVYQDTDPSEDPGPNTTINYQVLGNYPCRALVVNFNEINQFSCGLATGPQTTQIVIYEISNIIEVYVNRRVPCTTWQQGAGVIGIQNAAGTVAYTPAGRNTGPWSATNEAWRFSPNAPAPVALEWIQNGVVIGTNANVIVNVTDDTTVTAQATYTVCDGSNVVISSDIDIIVTEELPTLDPLELSACSTDASPVFDLTLNEDYVLSNSTAANYDVEFYLTEAAAIADADGTEITNPQAFVGTDGQTIWMNITSNAGCTVIKSFILTFGNHVPAFTLNPANSPISVCQGTTTTVTVQPGNFNLADAFYEWTLPDNTIATTVTPSLEVPVNGMIGTYSVKVKTDCETTQSFVVNINALPVVDPQLFASPTCTNTTGGIIHVSPIGNYEYSIDNGVNYQASNEFTGLQAQMTYTFTVRDLTTGCVSSEDYTFAPIPGAPQAPVVPAANIIQPTCTNNASFTVSSPVNGPIPYTNLFISEVTDADSGSLSYVEIYNGTGVTVNLSNYKLKFYTTMGAPSCDFTLVGTLANGATHVVKVSADANIVGVVPNQTVTTCTGVNIDDRIHLTTSSGSQAIIDVWGTPDGTVFTPSGQPGYVYRRLQTAAAPSTTWSAADWNAIDPEDYTNLGSYTPLMMSFQYSIDNGTTWQTSPTFPDPTTTNVLVPGTTYNVVVQNMANPGCISPATAVVINPVVQPTASISYAASPYCSGTGSATVTFAGSTGGVYSAVPSTGLSIDTNGTVDLNTSAAGTYTVSYTIAATMNCPEVVATAEITILPSSTPVTGFSYTTPVCSDSANQSPVGVAGFTTGGVFTADPGLTVDAATGEIDMANSTPGTYTVTYTVAATVCGPMGQSTFAVTITELPVAMISYDASPYCENSGVAAVTFSGTTGGTYDTNPSGAGLVINPATGEVDINNSTVGTYTVEYTIPAAAGCPAVVASTTITIAPLVTMSLSSAAGTDTQTVCQNEAVVDITYAVSNATGATVTGLPTGVSGAYASGVVTITGTPTQSGTFNYTVTTSGGCGVVTATGTIEVNPLPTASISSGATTICYEGTTTITFTGTPNAEITYSVDGATQTITLDGTGMATLPTPVLTSNSTYVLESVTLVATSCTQTLSESVTITVLNELEADITGECIGLNYTLTAISVSDTFNPADATYSWTGPNGFTGNTQSVTATAAGTYQVVIMSQEGCTITYSESITPETCLIPKGISPNNDGLNDSWDLEGLGVRKVNIFNRYGA